MSENETRDEAAEVLKFYPAPWTVLRMDHCSVVVDASGAEVFAVRSDYGIDAPLAILIAESTNYRATRERLGCWGEAEANLKLIEELAQLRGHADHRDEQVRILQAERDSARADAGRWESKYGSARRQLDESDERANKYQRERDEARAELARAGVPTPDKRKDFAILLREFEALPVDEAIKKQMADSLHAYGDNIIVGQQEMFEEVWNENESLKARIAALEAGGRWVAVGERLPELGQYTQTSSIGDYWPINAMWNGNHFVHWQAGYYMHPTHWRPLPAPPVAEKGERP